MTPEPEYATFYRLLADVETTRADWEKWSERLATANRRDRTWSTADWHTLYRIKAEYEAALALMAAFVRRMDAAPVAPEAETA